MHPCLEWALGAPRRTPISGLTRRATRRRQPNTDPAPCRLVCAPRYSGYRACPTIARGWQARHRTWLVLWCSRRHPGTCPHSPARSGDADRAGRLIAVDVSSTFGALVGQLEYSMFIVTVRAGDELAGCLVGFGCQSSIDPPRFLTCLSRRNHTYRVAMSAPELAVHFVPRQADALVQLFGGCTGDVVDKFARCAWKSGPAGLP